MRVVYKEDSDMGICPYLTSGKEYDVVNTIEIENEGTFYMIDDDDDDSSGCPEPYQSSLFEIVQHDEMKIA